MRRALSKRHPRLVGVDDGAFARGDRTAPVAAVVVSAPERVESIRLTRVRVNGRDGTERIIRLLRLLDDRVGIRAVLLDGPVVGGFNVLDLDAIRTAVGVPVIAVTRRRPDAARIRAALERWFPRTAEARLALLRQHRLFRVRTGGLPIWAAASGCTAADAVHLLHRATARGYWPEPLRLAHLIASAVRSAPQRTDRTIKGRRRSRPVGPVA
ncbi:MAG: DUF99 family protein [Thermoplasmata archaeon]